MMLSKTRHDFEFLFNMEFDSIEPNSKIMRASIYSCYRVGALVYTLLFIINMTKKLALLGLYG